MIRHVIRKEMLENLLSLRFVLSLLLVISLFAASGFAFVGKYSQQSRDYWRDANKNLANLGEQTGRLYQLAFYEQQVLRKPKPLTLCAAGFERTLPNSFKFNAFGSSLPEVKGRGNFTLPHFSDIDWVFIISLIVSFVALVLTYDSICGEKRAGTLRQMLAGAIPRHKILLGKYFGVMLTLGIPLLLGLLVNLVVVVSSKDVAVNGGDWLRIAMIVLLSFMYVSIFVLLGIFVSSRTAHSANCMVVLLLVWVGLVILIPSSGRIISEVYSRTPTRVDLERTIEETEERVTWDVVDRIMDEHPDLDDPTDTPAAEARLHNARTDAKNRILEDHHNQMVAQAATGRNLTCISPAVVYQRASEAIAGTGINHCVSLYEQTKRYGEILKEYVRGKDQEDPDSLHLLIPFDYAVESWGAISHQPVDFDTVPKFQERDLALGESVKLAIWDIGLLALFNLLFFAASFVSFLRYDVR
jgi:ABC-type transport system involved in multi-copper enzyme maturation permease subunit